MSHFSIEFKPISFKPISPLFPDRDLFIVDACTKSSSPSQIYDQVLEMLFK